MRDDFSEEIKRIVALRVNFRCSNPICRASTSGPQVDPKKSLNVGVAAHITAASPGGPRYNPSSKPEDRKNINNAIWLCQTCAKLIDNDEARFTESTLKDWKEKAEKEALSSIGKTEASVSPNDVSRLSLLDERFKMVIEDYKIRGTPKHMIDTFDDLSIEEKA